MEQVSGPSTTAGWGSAPRGPATPLHALCSHAWLCHDLLLGQGRSCRWDMSRQLTASRGSFLTVHSVPAPKEWKLPPGRELSLAFFPRQLPETPSERTAPPLLPPRTYRPCEEQHGPVQLPQEAQGPHVMLRHREGWDPQWGVARRGDPAWPHPSEHSPGHRVTQSSTARPAPSWSQTPAEEPGGCFGVWRC